MIKMKQIFRVMLFIGLTLSCRPSHQRMSLFLFEGSMTVIPFSWKMACMSVISASMRRKLRIRISPVNLWT